MTIMPPPSPRAIAVESTALVLLAAGRSRRFGDAGSKLTEDYSGRPLGLHLAVALAELPFMARLAITGTARLNYAAHGFAEIRNDDPDRGMSGSVRLGVERARAIGAEAVLIALADMPCVTADHIRRLFDAADGPAAVVASSDGSAPRPPALFGRDRFDRLLALTGEDGARALIRGGRHVPADPTELIDVDTRDGLERLRAGLHDPARAAHS